MTMYDGDDHLHDDDVPDDLHHYGCGVVTPVRKSMTSLVRHQHELREPDGAVEWRRLLNQFQRSHFPADVSKWGPQEWIDRLKRDSNKTRFEYCLIL